MMKPVPNRVPRSEDVYISLLFLFLLFVSISLALSFKYSLFLFLKNADKCISFRPFCYEPAVLTFLPSFN
jgi:hypothetical protein